MGLLDSTWLVANCQQEVLRSVGDRSCVQGTCGLPVPGTGTVPGTHADD
jgi:hypothetical protein